MKVITIVFMTLPTIFCGLAVYAGTRDVTGTAQLTWLGFWMFFSIACPAWGFYIRGKHPLLAWGCVAASVLQFALLFIFAVAASASVMSK